MKKKPNQHVVKREQSGRWAVVPEGGSRASSTHKTQREAYARAREIAKNTNSELITHGRDGRIRRRESYGNDPFPPRG